MAPVRIERRLAAILAADVVGYSNLIEQDERRTLTALKDLWATIIDPLLDEHHGRVVKLMGDGALFEFGSVVDAVAFAVATQKATAKHQVVVSDARRIIFRMGVNLGDVVVEGEDLLGDGVNIAARLEQICLPGGVMISGTAYDHLQGKLDVGLEFAGEQRVKNIARAIRCYRVHVDGGTVSPALMSSAPVLTWLMRRKGLTGIAAIALLALAGTVQIAGGLPWLVPRQTHVASHTLQPGQAPIPTPSAAPRLSAVVLPFQDLTSNHAEEYLADGLTDDITAGLSHIAGSFVIARNSAETYKGKPVGDRVVARELAVRYVLRGTVRRVDDQVRINATLIDGDTGAQLWSDRFDHDIRDLAAFQDEVTGRIVNSLGLELISTEVRKSDVHRANDPDAIDQTLRGWWLLRQPDDRQRLNDAQQLFERALTKEPQSVPGLVGLAMSTVEMAGVGWTDNREGDLQRARDVIDRALALAPQNPVAHYVKCHVFFETGHHDEAIDSCEASIALDRNYAPAYGYLAAIVRLNGQPERAIALFRQATQLSPRDPDLWMWLQFLARAQSDLGRQDEAITNLQKAIAVNPGAAPFQWTLLATVYARAKRYADSRAAMDTFLQLSPGLMEGKSDDVVRAMKLQIELALRGHYLGVIDGGIGRQTRRALASFQREQSLPVTEQADAETLTRLGLPPPGPDSKAGQSK